MRNNLLQKRREAEREKKYALPWRIDPFDSARRYDQSGRRNLYLLQMFTNAQLCNVTRRATLFLLMENLSCPMMYGCVEIECNLQVR